MSTESLTAAIKTRISEDVKKGIKAIADARHLEMSDIAREALREYLANHPIPEGNGANGANGAAQAAPQDKNQLALELQKEVAA